MHYRSDIGAGQQFGTVLALRLMEQVTFQAQMAKAKSELQVKNFYFAHASRHSPGARPRSPRRKARALPFLIRVTLISENIIGPNAY